MYIPTSKAPPTTLQCTNLRGTLSLKLIFGDKTGGVGCVGEIKVQISSDRVNDEGLTLEASAQLSKSFKEVTRPLLAPSIKPNFHEIKMD